MFIKKRAFITLLAFLLGAQLVHAQSFSDRVVFHRGFFIGLLESPRFAAIAKDVNGVDSASAVSSRDRNIQLGLNWGTSVLLYELDTDKSIRLGASLAASAFMSTSITDVFDLMDGGIGYGLQIPLTINYYHGHMATKYATSDYGFNIGVGVEINRISSQYSYINDLGGSSIRFELDQASYLQPVLNFGYSYWNNSDLARTVNFQVGFGKNFDFYGEKYARPTFRLSLHKYINY